MRVEVDREDQRNVRTGGKLPDRRGDALHPVPEILPPVAGHADDPLAGEARFQIGQPNVEIFSLVTATAYNLVYDGVAMNANGRVAFVARNATGNVWEVRSGDGTGPTVEIPPEISAYTGLNGETIQASVVRTARRLFSGYVYATDSQRLAG